MIDYELVFFGSGEGDEDNSQSNSIVQLRPGRFLKPVGSLCVETVRFVTTKKIPNSFGIWDFKYLNFKEFRFSSFVLSSM
ncbi:hypothetical protein ASD98_04540 [Flavobacterium sp. Root186]|nr:hypothetical protein ASD98_04540 [Flavobacterium sp. Root186]